MGVLHPRKRDRAKRGWRCPDEVQLAAYADGHLDAEAKVRIENHIADCAFCLGQVAALVRAKEEESPVEVPAALLARAQELVGGRPARAFSPAWGWASVAAAAACLVLVVSLQFQQSELNLTAPLPPAAPSVQPASPAPAAPVAPVTHKSGGIVRKARPVEDAPQITFPRDGGVLTTDELEFRWNGPRESVAYEVRVVTADGDLVWEGQTDTAQIRLPRDVSLVPGNKYFVWILAHLPDGRTVKSRAIAFRLADRR